MISGRIGLHTIFDKWPTTLNFAALHRIDSEHSDVIYNFRLLCTVHTVDAEHIHPLLSVRFKRLSVHKAFYRYRPFLFGANSSGAIHRRCSRRQFEVDFRIYAISNFEILLSILFRCTLDGFAVLMVTIHIKATSQMLCNPIAEIGMRFASSHFVGI